MTDGSGNNIVGAIGSAVQVGTFLDGATGYAWDNGSPTAPPPKPERLVTVNDSRLNPGNRDYAITMRFRTTRSYGNMIQKGQSQTPGGYFKWEIPSGILTCLFRSRELERQRSWARSRSSRPRTCRSTTARGTRSGARRRSTA